jgi:hypothetical protein
LASASLSEIGILRETCRHVGRSYFLPVLHRDQSGRLSRVVVCRINVQRLLIRGVTIRTRKRWRSRPATCDAAGRRLRCKVANAITLLNGEAWDQGSELARSLALRVESGVGDSAMPLIELLAPCYPTGFKTAHGLKVKALLVTRSSNKGLGAYPVATASFLANSAVTRPWTAAATTRTR